MRFPARSLARLLTVVVMIVACATGSRAADRFLSVIDDLPLMAELEEVAGSAVVYSKPQGRIVEVAAQGSVTDGAVRAFYSDTLPQLGWKRTSDDTWQRAGERLRLSFETGTDALTVQFSLAPL